MEALVYGRLTGNSEVAALVGTRVYPLHLPQAPTYPAIAYSRISTVEAHTHDRAGGLSESRLQVDCLAANYAGARALAGAVRGALDGWVDRDNNIMACLLENEFDLYDDLTETFRVIIDFMLKWR
jgi:hypothetical protein